MILIGQYDSPFVRRVAIAMRLYGLPFEHWPWSTFGDRDRLADYNPLSRVPTLLLDDGDVLIESAAILDYLDEIAEAGKPLIAGHGIERRQALKICALATGLADKAVSLLYEGLLRKEQSPVWVERCETQIGRVLDVLEQDFSARGSPFWFGNDIGHADIAVACALRFVGEAHGHLVDVEKYPALATLAGRCEALAPFQEIVQPLAPPSA
ncbi:MULTISPECIES: glutathione S-transferase family protein [Brucella/Ochrobactrum group]|uniref:Glutathione S-transferase family protein n=2 Tax=Ochrobactrum TaxID=528 RepID=A0ABD5JW20_9HYPH|nr:MULTISPECIES: glutathione S-transferase family protein [Brucella]MCI1000703.1 glutathione S-transferase family protein [Ochrobactrum sp. C6C9]RRD27986.1 glutathione S-transferase family protein [Brucellaceae bacterium VT-16-1752]WHT41160.1 glutathione S-transferase family protein [Ochrobactrum sp. SSR]MDX4075789.1 glutathione S-transferase family protein [Brucella sp. NBRC 113783]RLL75292.1 glutathione S-transferase family protein [[Ochrobactrum] soli]